MASLSETTRKGVLDAIDEHHRLGRDAFLRKYGFGPANKFTLVYQGQRYDSKAIVGAARGFDRPDLGPLAASEFSGGQATVGDLLERLGFQLEVSDEPEAEPAKTPKVWWVNQGKTYAEERAENFIWAPQLNSAGRPMAHHVAVFEVEAGDVILHYSNKALRSVGVAQTDGFESQRPSSLDNNDWGREGYRVDVEYHDFPDPISLTEIPAQIRERSGGPFTQYGSINQGYLYPLDQSVFAFLVDAFPDYFPSQIRDLSVSIPSPREIAVPTGDLTAVADAFAEEIKASGLAYPDEMIRVFLASLATKRFLIFSGLSGSGKTKLAQAFGQWIGEDRHRIVPVRPDWTSPDALLGYENGLSAPIDGAYAWHVPTALEIILAAANDPDHPYLLLLDEMNLAHVERYFADLLSGMESGAPTIPNLLRTDDGWRVADVSQPLIPVPANLFVIGTINVDETTYVFSPKVLDRANTIEFRVSTDSLTSEAEIVPLDSDEEMARAFLAEALSRPPRSATTDLVAGWMKKLHVQLAADNREFGHRVFQESIRFTALLDAATSDGDTKELALDALDLQVLQKILPKLHGSIRDLNGTLNAIGSWCHGGPDVNRFDEEFDPRELGAAVSPVLPRSFDKIARMSRRLHKNHFVSFAE